MDTQDSKIKVVIVDDDRLVANLLSDYFEKSNMVEPLYIANSGNDFFEKLESIEKQPDVIILDLRMEDGNGLDVLELLLQKGKPIKTIVMSSHYDPLYMGQMLKLGCDAFLSKETDPEELIEIIEIVHERGHYFTEEQISNMRTQISTRGPKLSMNSKDSLSEREIEVLKLLGQQLTTKEIATKLFISPKTVEMHKSNLLLKTGVKNSVGLIIYAIQNKLIDPNDLILLN
jgi:DNA-binding NarL/FixJ family response regulator